MRKPIFRLLLLAIALLVSLQLKELLRLTSDDSLYSNYEEIYYDLPLMKNNATSQVYCVGENFMNASSWQFKSCHYRNICWENGEWTMLVSKEQERLERDNLFSSSRLQQDVSTIGLTKPSWVRNKNYIWKPKLYCTECNGIHQQISNKIVLIVSLPPIKPSTFELLVDTILPLYNLVDIFALHKGKRIHVHVLNEDIVLDNDEYRTTFKMMLNWMGYKLFVPPTKRQCLSEAASGIGRLTVNGLTKRGYIMDDYQTTKILNYGRGSLMRKFRNHICKSTCIASNSTKIVGLALPKTHSLYKIMFEGLTKEGVQGGIDNVGPSKAIQIASSSKLWIALANNDTYTWPAMFLPQGGHLVLLYDPNIMIKNKRQKNKISSADPVRQDFGFWNQMSHIKVHWLSLSHEPQTLLDLFQQILEGTEKSNQRDEEGKLSGSFNSQNIRMKKYNKYESKSHCIGENWMWDATNHRSCHMEHFCFDMKHKTFVLDLPMASQTETKLLQNDLMSILVNNETTKVMMGQSIRLGTGDAWYPDSHSTEEYEYYYALDPNVVWLPFFAEQPNINNPGHLLWDYWLPLFTLLDTFHVQPTSDLLLTTLDPWCVPNNPARSCYDLTTKFLPLLGANPNSFSSIHDFRLIESLSTKPKGIDLVCAEHGLAGIGMLTDHGIKKHGQLREDYKKVHNVGRGGQIWDFRNFMLSNLGIPNSQVLPKPLKVTFSLNSSNNPSRRRDFQKQVQTTKQLFEAYRGEIEVKSVIMGELSLMEQISIVRESAVFISVMGGSACTAMFLERDTSLILYYNDIDDFAQGASKDGEKIPNRMDWDFWNNASFLRVYWLPISTMDEEKDLNTLTRLVKNEIRLRRLI